MIVVPVGGDDQRYSLGRIDTNVVQILEGSGRIVRTEARIHQDPFAIADMDGDGFAITGSEKV